MVKNGNFPVWWNRQEVWTSAIHDQKRFVSFAIRFSQPAACRTLQVRSIKAKIGVGAYLSNWRPLDRTGLVVRTIIKMVFINKKRFEKIQGLWFPSSLICSKGNRRWKPHGLPSGDIPIPPAGKLLKRMEKRRPPETDHRGSSWSGSAPWYD